MVNGVMDMSETSSFQNKAGVLPITIKTSLASIWSTCYKYIQSVLWSDHLHITVSCSCLQQSLDTTFVEVDNKPSSTCHLMH